MWLCPKCQRPFPKKLPLIYCDCGAVLHDLIESSGPGTELAKLLKTLQFKPTKKCGCAKLQWKMDQLGCDGCRRDAEQLCELLREKYQHTHWTERIRAVGFAVLTGIAFKLNIADPIPDVLSEAIRRAESCARKHEPPSA